jgi:hypothetical protein
MNNFNLGFIFHINEEQFLSNYGVLVKSMPEYRNANLCSLGDENFDAISGWNAPKSAALCPFFHRFNNNRWYIEAGPQQD